MPNKFNSGRVQKVYTFHGRFGNLRQHRHMHLRACVRLYIKSPAVWEGRA